MDINAVTSVVATLGFPIVMCGAMGYYVKYTQDQSRNEMSKLNEQHKEEIDNVTGALNNNTLALQKLVDVIGGVK